MRYCISLNRDKKYFLPTLVKRVYSQNNIKHYLQFIFVIPSVAEESLFLEITSKITTISYKMNLKEIPTG